MRVFLQKCVLLLLIAPFMTGGCAPQLQEEDVQTMLQQSRATFVLLERLSIQDSHLQDYLEARRQLERADALLQASQYEQAYRAAQQSLTSSQKILQSFYQNTSAQSPGETQANISALAPETPDKPIKDVIPKFNEILDYSEEIQSDQRIINLSKVIENVEVDTPTDDTSQTISRQGIEFDFSFESGEYELSDRAKHILGKHVQSIITAKKKYARLNPHRTVTVTTTIEVSGYTDEVGFIEGGELFKKLTAGVETDLPLRQPARRQFLNQRLSEFRANRISAYLTQFIENAAPTGDNHQLEHAHVGRGEEIPAHVEPSYPRNDPRRRICKISISLCFCTKESE